MITSQTQAVAPSTTELVSRAAALRELLWSNAEQADRDRRLSEDVVAALNDAGLFRLMTPKRLGGYETNASTLIEVIAEIGKGDMSAAWVAGVLNWAAWQIGLFPEQAQQDVWGENPDATACWVMGASVQHTVVDGGIVVSGKWANASGSAHSDWAVLSVPMSFGPKGPDYSMVLIPMSELTIVDTWFVTGVRASASNTLVAEDVFIPDHRILPLLRAQNGECFNGHPEEKLYRSPYTIGGLAIMAPQLGVVSAMFEYVQKSSQGKMVPAAGVMDMSAWPSFQMEFAAAATKIDLAWLLAGRAASCLDTAAQTGELPDDRIRGQLRIDPAWVSKELHEAAEILMNEAGVSAFGESSPLQRMWRDISTAHRHTAFRLNPVKELYGRILLGKDSDAGFMF
ncbi:acyl-CoA dehydrogenase family protein [Nocardia sp. NPDC059246]|uniref:acyl-CoA dehydrogenase family protein n=1 Tax=unclassified Nocardia TaxID=2637762 RepID=UPI0036C59DEF